ncbi:MAG: hypothetical protein JNL85_08650 [Rubrivivax sp.]|nr:hypothetical protein [Rubrivivax sp.]
MSLDTEGRARVALPARAGIGEDRVLTMPMPGVPVQVLRERDSDTAWIFLRQFPDDRLWLLRFDGERLRCRMPVDHGADATAKASLRTAALHGEHLHAIYYHNASLTNWHVAWRVAGPGDKAAADCPASTGSPTALPSLEDPAGATYEMIAPLRLHAVAMTTTASATPSAAAAASGLVLAGGNLEALVGERGVIAVRRLPECHHIVESVPTPRGLAHLCVAAEPQPPPGARTGAEAGPPGGARPPIVVVPEGIEAPRIDLGQGVPWRLAWSLGRLHLEHARTPRQLRHLLRRDLARTTPGGWMEFGIGNEEGRIPWSQMYYLEGLLDLLALAGRDAAVFDLFAPLLREARLRLDLEMHWLDAQVLAGRHRTRAFTVDRSPALFGVQTARLLLLSHRYAAEVPQPLPLPSHAVLKRAVPALAEHIEVLAASGEEARWIRPGRHHLRWPKGSKFAFDGMAVPYNHQDEWAHAVLATADASTPAAAIDAATDVLRHFVERIAPQGRLPASGTWDYWWGHAWDGWAERDALSVNTPRYGGDRIAAWISFRTIDAMALVAGAPRLGAAEAANARASAQALAADGALYPLANRAWLGEERPAIHLGRAVAHEYARVSAPWELANAVWSLASLAARDRPR